MEKVIILPTVMEKIEHLTMILFEKDYFSFPENAIAYTNAIYDFIYTIPTVQIYPCSSKKFGHWYCRYKPNRHTTWYLTFDTDGEVYLVKNIINNHTRNYAAFLRMIE